MSVQIIRGDALDLPLPDAAVDLTVTSPPYFGLRSYQDGGKHYDGQIGDEATPAEFVDALIAATREMARVLKPSGSIWVNLGDKYASGGRGEFAPDTSARRRVSTTRPQDGARPKTLLGIPWRYALRCIDDLGLILRAEVIWSKPNGLPESVTDRVRRSHETWFHFVKQPRYYSAVDEIREPQATADRDGPRRSYPAGSSVWTIPTQPLTVPPEVGVDHFAAFPMEWPRRIIRGWSPPGGTVLDPFGGTGTTALVAHALGRHGISVDLSADYCRLAEWRTSDPGQLAAAMQVEKPPEQPHGVDSLLDLVNEGAKL